MDEQRWLDALQETMLAVLIICRFLISREHMTVEKSGIVLFISIVNGADLLAMAHSLQYHDIIIDRIWTYVGLVVLSVGLFQMSFIDTDGLTRTTTSTTNRNSKRRISKRMHLLQDQNICPLFRVKYFHFQLVLFYICFLFLVSLYS